MVKYLLRRFCEMILTLFLIATATFFLLEAVPEILYPSVRTSCSRRQRKLCIRDMVWISP